MVSRLAKVTRARVLWCIATMTDEGYEVIITPAWKDFPTADVEADTRRVNEELEQWIRRFPDQYLWVHRRFKSRPEVSPRSTERSEHAVLEDAGWRQRLRRDRRVTGPSRCPPGACGASATAAWAWAPISCFWSSPPERPKKTSATASSMRTAAKSSSAATAPARWGSFSLKRGSLLAPKCGFAPRRASSRCASARTGFSRSTWGARLRSEVAAVDLRAAPEYRRRMGALRGGNPVRLRTVSMGNPHAGDPGRVDRDAPLTTLGPKVENHRAFPQPHERRIRRDNSRPRTCASASGSAVRARRPAAGRVPAPSWRRGVASGALRKDADIHVETPGGTPVRWAGPGAGDLSGTVEKVLRVRSNSPPRGMNDD